MNTLTTTDNRKSYGAYVLIVLGISLLLNNLFGVSLIGLIVNLFTSMIGLIVKIGLVPVKLLTFGLANMSGVIGIVLIIMGINYLRKKLA